MRRVGTGLFFAGGALLLAALPLLGLLVAGLFTDLLPQREVYASLEYGFSLLPAASAALSATYLVSLIYRCCWVSLDLRALPAGAAPVEPASGGSGKGEDWPLLVALLFGTLLVLFSGLGGWVDAL